MVFVSRKDAEPQRTQRKFRLMISVRCLSVAVNQNFVLGKEARKGLGLRVCSGVYRHSDVKTLAIGSRLVLVNFVNYLKKDPSGFNIERSFFSLRTHCNHDIK
jgi:hypothetical protein